MIGRSAPPHRMCPANTNFTINGIAETKSGRVSAKKTTFAVSSRIAPSSITPALRNALPIVARATMAANKTAVIKAFRRRLKMVGSPELRVAGARYQGALVHKAGWPENDRLDHLSAKFLLCLAGRMSA